MAQLKDIMTTLQTEEVGNVELLAKKKNGDIVKVDGNDVAKASAGTDEIHNLPTATEADLKAGNYFALDGAEGTKRLPAEVVAKGSNVLSMLENDYNPHPNAVIRTGTTIGEQVSLAEERELNWECLSFQVKEGDVVSVKGNSGTNVRLWAILDNNKILRRIAGEGSLPTDLVIENDGYFVYNAQRNGEHYVRHYSLSVFKKFKEENNLIEVPVFANAFGTVPVNSVFNQTENLLFAGAENWESAVIKAFAGDVFDISAQGGSGARAYAVCDVDKKFIVGATAGQKFVGKYIMPFDGYFVWNNQKNSNAGYIKRYTQKSALVLDEEIEKNEVPTNTELRRIIRYSLTVGSVCNFDAENTFSWNCGVEKCYKGDKIHVKGLAGSSVRLWAIFDNDKKFFAAANVGVTEAIFEMPIDGYVVYNNNFINTSIKPSFFKRYSVKGLNDYTEKKYLEDRERLLYMGNISLGSNHDFIDVEEDISGFNFSSENTLMEQVYTHFDSLVSDFPLYVEKVDAAVVAGIAYPSYASGYKMYMYKFLGDSTCKVPKKKLFIVAGVHGVENSAPVNSFIFAKNLCKGSKEIYHKIRDFYDVYIIPCVNGWGMNNLSRYNYNNVDINRNYPVSGWSYSADNHTGSSAMSEFETKVIVAVGNEINADVYVDHHNFFEWYTPFVYQVCNNDKTLLIERMNAIDCCVSFHKNLPNYFGHNYNELESSATPQNQLGFVPTYNEGTAVVYWSEKDKISATIEICKGIYYSNGEITHTTSVPYSKDSFSCSEYMLRNFVYSTIKYLTRNV